MREKYNKVRLPESFGYINLPGDILSIDGLSILDSYVFKTIKDLSEKGKYKKCFASNLYLAQRSGVSERTITRILKLLESKNLIIIHYKDKLKRNRDNIEINYDGLKVIKRTAGLKTYEELNGNSDDGNLKLKEPDKSGSVVKKPKREKAEIIIVEDEEKSTAEKAGDRKRIPHSVTLEGARETLRNKGWYDPVYERELEERSSL